jgi:predicted glycosyltransferase
VKVWIDLANSPQVLFFRPILAELERRGHSVVITTRHFAQTIELADQCGMTHVPVGGHGGKRLSRIGLTLVERAWKLMRFAAPQRCDVAVSHNSYAQAIAASALRLPIVTSMDYEHQPANHLCFRLADRVIVPESFPGDLLAKFGARPRKTSYYSGVKEQIYLSDFRPDPGFRASLGVPADRTMVVLRPPGSWGLYHDFENPLFERVLAHVAGHDAATVLFLPRVPSQAAAVRAAGYRNVIVPDRALDGPNLLHHADAVISGGGTMNREAAVLGTPAYSVFKGKSAAVDRFLIARGRMAHISDEAGIARIRIEKKQPRDRLPGEAAVSAIADAIQDAGRKTRNR